jgi:hypothetical protein
LNSVKNSAANYPTVGKVELTAGQGHLRFDSAPNCSSNAAQSLPAPHNLEHCQQQHAYNHMRAIARTPSLSV